MRWLTVLLLGAIAVLPVAADSGTPDSNRAYTLTSVLHPGYMVTEAATLCSVSLPGSTAPLRFKIVEGLANPKGVSLQSATDSGYFLRHQGFRLKLHPFPEGDNELFLLDATFYLIQNDDGTVSFRSVNFPEFYISVTAHNELHISPDPEVPARSFILGN